MRRACKHPLNSAKPLQQLHRRSETVLVFPSCQNIIVLVGGVVLPLPHAASGTDRLAHCPSCKAYQKSVTSPLAKKVPYVTRPASCSHPGMFAVPVARRHRIPFSILACMLLLRHPHAGFGAYRRAAQKARRKNRKDNQCLRSAKGVLLLCPHADFGAGQRQVSPTALSRYLGLNRKACHPSALTQASGRVPAFRRAESGGTKLRDSAL